MRRRAFWHLARLSGAAAIAITVATPAAATLDEVVARAIALEREGKAADAYRLLQPLEGSRAGDPDFDYAFGLAAADSGHKGQAIVALQRVIAVQPDNAQARAEIARVYAMAGDIDTARAEFNTVLNDPSVPDPVRRRFDALVRSYDRQIGGGGMRATGFVEGEVGYDSNINSATGLTSITLPAFAFFGPATLGGAATRIGKGFDQVQGGLSVEAGLGRSTRGYVSALGVYRDAWDLADFDQAALTGTAGIAHTLANRDVISLSSQTQRFWLARTGYRTSYGGIGQYTKRLGEGQALSFVAQYAYLDYDLDQLRDADRFSGGVSYAGKLFYAAAEGGREDTRRNAARHLGFGYGQGTIGTELPVAARTALVASASAEYRDYDAQDPLFLRGRHDTQLDYSVGLRFVLAPGISVRPRATYTRNISNLKLYDYHRVTASVSLRGEF